MGAMRLHTLSTGSPARDGKRNKGEPVPTVIPGCTVTRIEQPRDRGKEAAMRGLRIKSRAIDDGCEHSPFSQRLKVSVKEPAWRRAANISHHVCPRCEWEAC